MRRATLPWTWDLLAALGLLLLLDALVALGVQGPVRVVLGIPAVLLVPGYLLVCALFPARHRVVEVRAGEAGEEETRRSEEGLDGLERVALSVGLSLAVVPLLGLGLNYSPWGIRTAPFLAALTVFGAAAAASAWRRRARLPPGDRFGVPLRVALPRWSAQSPRDKALGAVLLACALVALGALAYVLATPREGETFTEFYVLGAQGQAADYPTNLTRGQEASVRLVVVNHEGGPVTYAARMVAEPGRIVEEDGNRTFVPTGSRVLSEWTVPLEGGAAWEEEVVFRLDAAGPHRVRFELDRPGAPSPYRTLHLFVDVTG